MNTDPEHDRMALDALREGDDSGLDQLIDRWERPLFAFAWRYVRNTADAHDLVAETFVRLYQNATRLRPDTNLPGWLFTTLSRLCHNQHRWRMRHPTVSFDAHEPDGSTAVAEPADDVPGPGDTLVRDESVAALADAMSRLPHDLNTALLLHYFEQLSYRDIAGIVGCSERGVETRLYRARQRLRAELESHLRETAAP